MPEIRSAMTHFESSEPTGFKEPVEQVARLVHRFDRRNLDLTPEPAEV